MPEFILNISSARRRRKRRENDVRYEDLNTFARAYVEAMFFTNGDIGSDRENHLNELETDRLTRESIRNIAADCADFENYAKDLLSAAYARGYSDAQAGRDFWFNRQGHGVGFWDRGELDADGLGKKLSDAAHSFGEVNVDVWRGWIRY